MDSQTKPTVPTWIHSGGKYHILRLKVITTEKTGRVIARYDAALCTGHTIGGAWGSTRVTEVPARGVVCANCLAREVQGK